MSTPIDGSGVSRADDKISHGFFGHPRGLSTLFFTEMWERFSYYGMRAILTLYMTKALAEGGLGFDEKYAALIYATYVSSVWYLPLIGGWLADRSLRRATCRADRRDHHRLWPFLDGHQYPFQLLRRTHSDCLWNRTAETKHQRDGRTTLFRER